MWLGWRRLDRVAGLAGLGLGHHLGDQVPAQPHLPGLPLPAARATVGWAGGLVHKGPA
jgi:hypothetical protein